MPLVSQSNPFGSRFGLTYTAQFSTMQILLNSWCFYTKTLNKVKGVVTTKAKQIKVESIDQDQDLIVEADGELLGYGPVTFKLLTAKLKFIKP